MVPRPNSAHSNQISCPKCAYTQEQGLECLRCGIIFAKYRPPTLRADISSSSPDATRITGEASDPTSPEPSPSRLRQFFRIARWLSLAGTVTVLLLILRQPPPIPIQTDPQAAERVAGKLAHVEQALQAGTAHTLQLNEAELNQWLRDSLAIADAHRTSQAMAALGVDAHAELQEVQSGLKDIRVNLEGNLVRAQALFHLRGKDLSLQLEGRLSAQHGQLHLQPTGGKLGSLPLPQSSLDGAVKRLLESPQNRHSFQLPPQVQDIRVENGALYVTYREPPGASR